jgi:hypothetical protein
MRPFPAIERRESLFLLGPRSAKSVVGNAVWLVRDLGQCSSTSLLTHRANINEHLARPLGHLLDHAILLSKTFPAPRFGDGQARGRCNNVNICKPPNQ